jgi:hypothetical protein
MHKQYTDLSIQTLEILVHRAGYVFSHEQVTTHQRMRYHLIDKDPSLPGIDPAFWLVHYGPSDPENRRAVGGFPISPQIQKLMQERLFLEQQGAVLQRKEFMLMDRPNWPTVNTNVSMHPRQMHPAYQQNPMMARQQPQQPYVQPQLQQPPPKRVKIDRGVAQAIQKNEIPDVIFEEDTEFGDYFDTLTPAEISRTRYKQHHEWMEEIYSSVYSISQIVPEDLGFGLTGSLKELTDGILTAPDPTAVIAPFDPDKDKDDKRQQPSGSNGYRKLSAEKMDEFERRISQFVEKGKADIQAMKQQHAETVAQFNRSKTYMKAERKLRDVSGSDADIVVQEVETSLPAKVVEQKKKVCVEEGGLEKEEKSATVGPTANQETASSNGFSGNGNGNGNGMFGSGGDSEAAGLLDEFGAGSYTNSPAARIGTPGISQPQSGAPTPGATAGPGHKFMQQAADAADHSEQAPDDTGLDLLEGMDMDVDVDMGDLDNGRDSDSATKPGAEDDWVMVGDAQPIASTTHPSASAPAQPSQQREPTSTAAQTIPGSTIAEGPTSTDTPNATDTPNETSGMFDSADFGGPFDGLDTAGDALADFDAGGDDDDLGLDLGGGEFDGAFGDADQEHHG